MLDTYLFSELFQGPFTHAVLLFRQYRSGISNASPSLSVNGNVCRPTAYTSLHWRNQTRHLQHIQLDAVVVAKKCFQFWGGKKVEHNVMIPVGMPGCLNVLLLAELYIYFLYAGH